MVVGCLLSLNLTSVLFVSIEAGIKNCPSTICSLNKSLRASKVLWWSISEKSFALFSWIYNPQCNNKILWTVDKVSLKGELKKRLFRV